MRIAWDTFSGFFEEDFIKDVDHYLGKKVQDQSAEQAKKQEFERADRCADYHEELVKLVVHNGKLGKDLTLEDRSHMEPIPVEQYFFK